MFSNGAWRVRLTYNSSVDYFPSTQSAYQLDAPCEVPFYYQENPIWKDHPLRSDPSNPCTLDTIGTGGCTLTSAVMLFRYFGAFQTSLGNDMNPPNLSDCMWDMACPFLWSQGSVCSNGKAWNPYYIDVTNNDLSQLDYELNHNQHPVLLQLSAIGTNDPHWVIVISGQGNIPANYIIHDPQFERGDYDSLSPLLLFYEIEKGVVYNGMAYCSQYNAEQGSSEQDILAQYSENLNPVTPDAISGSNEPSDLSTSDIITGTAWIYEINDITMTVKVIANSSVGDVTDMLLWTDTAPNTEWQPYVNFTWLPLSKNVYAEFRDSLGNVSDTYSDSVTPGGPPEAPIIYLTYMPLVRK
jgi:hypothetical protein